MAQQEASILVTNDDGIGSPGLHALARRLSRHANVQVVAPSTDQSGAGTSLGTFHSAEGGLPQPAASIGGNHAWTVEGPPGMAVAMAMRGWFGPAPDLVVSGVNAGLNTGGALLHSGTVGAALTAASFGGRGCAVSLARGDPWQWDTAAEVACSVSRWMLEHPEGPKVLNVNIPSLPKRLLRGARWSELDSDFGMVHVAAVGAKGLTAQVAMTSKHAPTPESDTNLSQDGWVTLTPLEAVTMARIPDVPAEQLILT